MGKKTFVLDTNVILADPKALFRFKDNNIVIPLIVIEELDNFKKNMSQTGLAARTFSRFIEKLRQEGSLLEGVKTENGGKIQILTEDKNKELPLHGISKKTNDNIILAAAMRVRDDNPDREVTLVSKDINMRIKADVLGINSEPYKNERVNFSNLPKGFGKVKVDGKIIDHLFSDKKLLVEMLDKEISETFHPNKFIVFEDAANNNHKAIARVDGEIKTIHSMKRFKKVWGISPRNLEQKMAMDLLMNDDIPLVSLLGTAGTGKTLLSMAAAMQKCLTEGAYNRILIARPIYPMGKDIGYLPGSMDEKLRPWMQPVFDNLEFLLEGYSSPEFGDIEGILESGIIEVEALTYIRGRSIPGQFILVDEAQNLTPHEVKTIISRVGERTKIILTGDPYQIDNPYMNESSNGLSYALDRFSNSSLSGHIILQKGERSQLANAAAELL
ncbi:MAG: PhoH family protein [bacterium]